MDNKIYWHGRTYDKVIVENMRKNSFDRIDKDKHIEISRAGGIASGEARRIKAKKIKEIHEAFDDYMLASGYLEEDIRDFRQWQKERAKRKKSGL